MSDEDELIEDKKERFAVLDVFGLKLEVSNPRIAELLTMDAREALVTDVRDLASPPDESEEDRAEATEAMPDVVLTPSTAQDELDAQTRMEFRARVAAMGSAVGFDTDHEGIWNSPTGVTILTRAIESAVTLASATHYVTQLAARREELAGPDALVLFIAEGQQSADVLKVAIRQQRLYDVIRVISVENLEDVSRLYLAGAIDHSKVVVLLAPSANIDVGEILSVIRSASSGQPG